MVSLSAPLDENEISEGRRKSFINEAMLLKIKVIEGEICSEHIAEEKKQHGQPHMHAVRINIWWAMPLAAAFVRVRDKYAEVQGNYQS